MICLYVDDMLIIGTDLEIVKFTKKFLSVKFSIKDIGDADVILGIKILYTKDEIVLIPLHREYVEEV